MLLWHVFKERELAINKFLYLLSPVILGGLLIVVSFSVFDLWNTVALSKKVSASPEFRRYFSVKGFMFASFWGLQLVYIAFLLSLKNFWHNKYDVMFLSVFAGFGIMLFVGQIIPWIRYWAPVAPAATLWSQKIIAGKVRSEMSYRLMIAGVILVNTGYVLLKPYFA
jgi:hypothetical protein